MSTLTRDIAAFVFDGLANPSSALKAHVEHAIAQAHAEHGLTELCHDIAQETLVDATDDFIAEQAMNDYADDYADDDDSGADWGDWGDWGDNANELYGEY